MGGLFLPFQERSTHIERGITRSVFGAIVKEVAGIFFTNNGSAPVMGAFAGIDIVVIPAIVLALTNPLWWFCQALFIPALETKKEMTHRLVGRVIPAMF